jgi:Zn-dependent protease
MLFIQILFTSPSLYILWISLVILSVWLHEAAHVLAAYLQGDDTAYRSGYLFNPARQMGIVSIIALLLVGITWGAVPVNYTNLKKRYSPAIVALAGPITNFILFLAFCYGGTLVSGKSGWYMYPLLLQLFYIGGLLNFVLFVFNLIPVPPLDGWTALLTFVPKITRINRELRNGIMFGIFALLFLSFSQLFIFGQHAVAFAMKIFSIF